MGAAPVIPVAIIGMACRLPAGIDSPEQLWEALVRGDDLVTDTPLERWDAEEIFDPEPGVPGRSVSKWGAFIDNVAGFDAEFFGLSDREATAIDPQHRLLLETSWDALEHSGLNPNSLAGSKTGVFIGQTGGDYELLAADSNDVEGPYGFTGTNYSFASGRISYTLGLHGPAVTVDTACSSGLLSVHMACRSLNDGESDLAVAGGVSIMLESRKSISASMQGLLSPTGRCHSFDVAADGFVSGEACAVVILKRLPDAIADGDRVLAVVRGTATNQDGRTVNIATPSSPAQIEVYNAALDVAGVEGSSIGMVEAHGTGTPVGDPLEYASVAAVYGTAGPTALTSVKTNFGHTQSASGALSMIKAVLALQHAEVPKNLHFTALPEEMAKVKTNLFVPQELTPFPANSGQPRRAAVSSYGMSGTNAHAILEQAPETVATAGATAAEPTAEPQLFAISSTSPEELRRTSGRLADWLADRKDSVALADLGYTLARRRAHRPVRTAVLASTFEELIDKLREVADGDSPYQAAVGQDDRGPVWVFSGQGSQWGAMGAELLAKEPAFAAAVAELEPLIAAENNFSVTEAMSAPEKVTGIDQVQPTIFAMQVALAAAMRAYGVVPGAVIGHSMGEVAAAVVAGALSLQDAVRVICRRSRLMATIAGGGAMASVELPAAQVLSELSARGVTDVVLSVVASPTSTVVGGAKETILELVAAWEEREVMAREVAVDVASHSPQVDPILDDLEEALAELTPMTPTVPYYSSTLYDPRDEPEFDAYYWVDNLRHTVRFAAAVQAAMQDGHRVFAELSPHPLLTHAVQQTASSLDVPLAALAAMRREQEMPNGLRDFLADLHNSGAAVDFSVLYPSGVLVDAPLPTWTRRELIFTRAGHDSSTSGTSTLMVHPLLGPHVILHEEPERHVWQADVGTDAQPWLGDHQIHSVAALPGAAYCEIALAAARVLHGEGAVVRDIGFEQMLLLDEKTPISAVASVESPEVLNLVVETFQEGAKARRATAVLHAAGDDEQPAAYDMAALLVDHPDRLEGAEMRDWFDASGIQYGPAFCGLVAANTGSGVSSVLAEVALPGSIRSQQAAYSIHPALLDACFQSVIAQADVQAAGSGGLLLPLGVRTLRAYASARDAHYCYTRVTSASGSEIEADLDVLGEDGTVLVSVQGLRLGTGVSEAGRDDRTLNDRLLTIEWTNRPLPEIDTNTEPGAWLLISTSQSADALASALTEAMKSDGAECTTMTWPPLADHPANAERLHLELGVGGFRGVVVLTGPKDGNPDEEAAVRGGDYVRHLVRIARELPDTVGELPRLYTLTRKAQTVLGDDIANLEQAGLRGLMRVINTEQPHLRATQIDTDESTDISRIAQQLLSGTDEDESAWRDGEWYTARLTPTPLQPDERRKVVASYETDGMRLQIRTPGDLESMELVAFDRVAPGPGEIEVSVTASSINFADVLVTFGRYPSFEGKLPELGTDFAGVVTAVGPDVTNHKVGDHVGGMSANGCWGTFVITEASKAVTLPNGLTEAQAAAVTTASATAWYGLADLARIGRGDRVLIHSGTGGVGQAAIAIARSVGAEIYATAGSEGRRQVLRDMGIEHVYDSRSTDFADEIRRDTAGYGVDIVLNSLTGAAQRAGINLLSFGGRFVEIGKRDIYGDTHIGLFPFRRNLSFYAVDLGLMSFSHPDKVQEVLSTVYRLTVEGVLPVPESTHYPLGDAATAVRVMGSAGHTGKLVLDVPHSGQTTVVSPPSQAQVFRGDGAYIITGGMGGLGLFLADKMAEGGCGRIILNGRSKPKPEALAAIERIRARGTEIEVVSGDIADPATAERLVSVATVTGLPVRGVLHAAAVVEDATLTNITDELVDRDWAPKVYGAWNMHVATADQPIDWFCSFSSAAALVGSPGQGAYAAANSWLDAFTQWRRAQGLPANAVAWGAWAEIGAAVDTELAAEGAETAIAPDEGAYAFETLLRFNRAYTGYAPIVGTPWLTALAQRSKFHELFQSSGQNRADTSKFRAELNALPPEEWPTRIRRLVSDQISTILRRTIDPDRPLSEYGLDSLGNLEVRTRIETETGVRITSTDITTVRGLADHLCDKLSAQEPVPATT